MAIATGVDFASFAGIFIWNWINEAGLHERTPAAQVDIHWPH
ncbi:MAG: hypothetical protein ACYC46_07460 [Acidobacteriaceae bacterium]